MKGEGNYDLFTAGNHSIICGDSVEVLDSIENDSVDLIFADPPYNIGKTFNGKKESWDTQDKYLSWCYLWIEKCVAKLKGTGSFYLMSSTQSMPYLDLFIRDKMVVLSRIVWQYDSSGVQAKNHFGSLYEPILHCVKNKKSYTFNSGEVLVEAKTGSVRKLIDHRSGKQYASKKVPGNVWYIPRVRYKMKEYETHPTQKPTSLLDRIIKASSNKGDLVLDPFSGTFTTSYVSEINGRKSIGIEIERTYVDIGIRRMAGLNP